MGRAGKPSLVRRARLLRDLAATTVDVPLVLVTAPAGYGKTTVLNQWAVEDPRRFAWVNLDAADNDPVRLLRHITLALGRICRLDPAVWRALQSAQAPVVDVTVPRLLAATGAAEAPWVLVLDDAHLLRAGPCSDVVLAIADGLPPGCHLVVCGRSQPGLKLGGLRGQDRCVEVGWRELALDADEVAAVLAAAGARASGASVGVTEDLVRRAEGWAAGVHLAARYVSPGAGADGAGADSRAATAVFDYLRDEVLVHESVETLRFLIRTAPLERMSGPVCDAVLGTTGSAARLADLARRNVFVTPEGADRLWYRYHPLFRELLLGELRRWEPAEEDRTHRRAAAWYAEHGFAEPAVGHALAGRDTTTAARLVARCGQHYVNTGRPDVVRGWLRSLADGALENHPYLAVVAGWIWALAGDAARAQECLYAAERAVSGGRESTLVAAVARLRAALAPFGVERMRVDAREALELGTPGDAWYPMAAMLMGVAHLVNGDADAATRELERAAHFGREHQRPTASFALAQLSLLAAEREDWTAAEACAHEAADLAEAGHPADGPFGIAVYVALAKADLNRHDVRLARHHAAKAMRLYAQPSPVAFPWLAAQMATTLGRVLLDLGDHPAARLKAAEARRHLARLPTGGELGRQHRHFAEEVARHGEQARRSTAVTLTAAEMRVLRLLPTHLTLSEIADALSISRNTVKTQVSLIYGKLLASTRGEAVRAARDHGLVA